MTMQVRGTFLFWLALFVLLIFALVVFQPILLPFAVGLILAFILDPTADRLQRLGLSRAMSVAVIFSGLFLTIALILLLVVPLLAQQLSDFAQSLPGIMKSLQDFTTEQMARLRDALGPQMAERLKFIPNPFDTFIRDAAVSLAAFMNSIWVGGQAVFDAVSLLIITPIVACYLLFDWDRMVATVDKLLPRRDAPRVRNMAREINLVLASYLRGQGLICVILGLIYSAGLAAIGLNFALLIGLMSGLISFVPYVGNIIGLGTALLIAFAQFGPDLNHLLLVVIVYGIGQLVDGYILQPRLLGHAVGIHPVWLIFALYAFGLLFGFAGILLAVPMAACLGVLLRHALSYYTHTQLYRVVNRTEAKKQEKSHA